MDTSAAAYRLPRHSADRAKPWRAHRQPDNLTLPHPVPCTLQSLLIPPPEFPQGEALSPAQRRGLRYQRRVGKWLAAETAPLGWVLHSGPWLRDPATSAPCSPDFLIESPSCLIIVEVKLSQVDCTSQVAKYRRALAPLCCPISSVLVCRRLTAPSSIHRLSDFPRGGVMLAYL